MRSRFGALVFDWNSENYSTANNRDLSSQFSFLNATYIYVRIKTLIIADIKYCLTGDP